MKKIRALLRKPVFLLAVSAVLLAASTLGSAQAALTYYSENYSAQMSVSSIGVTLVENGEKVSWRDYEHQGGQWSENSGKLLQHLSGRDGKETVVPGKKYQEKLTVQNSGDIDAYVRVILYRDWQNPQGVRDTALSPGLIDLGLSKGNGWIVDEKASTAERTVLYYQNVLPAGEESPSLCDTLKIHSDIAKKAAETVVEDENGYRTITTRYVYDGYRFQLTAEVDAVQTHNAREAIKSAWGVDVDVAADDTLRLE